MQSRATYDACVTTLDESSPPRLIHFGEGFLLEKLPAGTRVIYPPAPLEPVRDVDAAIAEALRNPIDCAQLVQQLSPGMKVTIALDDLSIPLPMMKRPDVRERILSALLPILHVAGVDDAHIIVATGLHRRMTAAEIRRMVGREVFDAFYPDRLYNHDAEDPEGIVELGTTESGQSVGLNRRAAESDLVIYVNVNQFPFNGGHKSVSVGLADYETIRSHHSPRVLRATETLMEPERSELHREIFRIGRFVEEKLNVFQIETVLNNRMYGPTLDFLATKEEELSAWAWAKLRTTVRALRWLPRAVRSKIFQSIEAGYELVSIHAGAAGPVHAQTLARCNEQYTVPVQGQADVLILGIPYLSPYNVNSHMNPVLVALQALGYLHGMHRGTPLLRKGGTLILCHPCEDRFDPVAHASYDDFFHRLLPETRDAAELAESYERQFATDPKRVEAFRSGHAYHGAHPFFLWYWGEPGRQNVGRVIAAGAQDSSVTETLGWERAASLAEALAMAGVDAADGSSVTLARMPPIFICDVEA